MKKKILIYDDETSPLKRYANRLRELKLVKKQFIIEAMDNETFKYELKKLVSRQEGLRKGKEWDNESILDDVSILIIDYDLIGSLDKTSFFTGEILAYLARCFSKCGLIVGLNQYGVNPFDLTLRGHIESYADLNIGSKQLDNPGLWGGKIESFRPWCWPQLPNYLESYQERIKDVIDHRDEPIIDVLNLNKVVSYLPRSVSEFLGGDPKKISFKGFVIRSGNGLRGRRDKKATDEMIGRIGAARISKWLERLVLSGQDILVDAPHLVSRYPSLIKGNVKEIKNWNKTTRYNPYDKIGLNHEIIEESRYKKTYWISRPIWFWDEISNNIDIEEVKEPWKKATLDFVFCEDSSCFYKEEDCKDFVAELDTPYVRRFIRYFTKPRVAYRPRVRLLPKIP